MVLHVFSRLPHPGFNFASRSNHEPSDAVTSFKSTHLRRHDYQHDHSAHEHRRRPSTFSRALIKIVTSRPKSIKVFLATVRNIILAPFSIMPVSLDATRLAFLTRAHRHIAPTRLAFYTRTLRHVARAYLAFYRRTHRYVVRAHLALYRSTQRHVARAHLAFYRRTHMLRAYTRFFHWFHSYLTEESLSVASPYRSIL